MTTRIVSIVTLVLTLVALTVAGCAKPTVASQKARYQRVKDRLDAVATKTPALREGIQLKLAEFDRDMAAAEAQGAEAVKALGAVVSRAEAYEQQVTPTAAPAAAPAIDAGAPPAGSKLGGPPTTGAPGGKLGAPAAAGGKLGDPVAPAAAGGKLGDPAAPAGSSGFGGSGAAAAAGSGAAAPSSGSAAPSSGFGGH